MFGRKFKPEYKSKIFVGCEKGTNIAKEIIIPPEYNPVIQLTGILCFAGVILNIFFSFEASMIISLSITTICLYSMTEPIE